MPNTNTKNQKVLLRWTAGGENKDPNAPIWMGVLFLLTGGSLIYNIAIGKWMVSAIFVLLIIILIWYFFSSAKTVDIVIGDQGIQLNNQFYSFENIKGYWYIGGTNTLYIAPKKKSGMTISFPIGNKKYEEIKENLPTYLTEIEGRGEDLMDRVSNLFHM